MGWGAGGGREGLIVTLAVLPIGGWEVQVGEGEGAKDAGSRGVGIWVLLCVALYRH